MTQVKICGINDEPGFDTAVEAGADWVGFVFYPKSPRYVSPLAAAELSRRESKGPLRIGLFVDPVIEDIGRVLDKVPLDGLQIYGATGLLPVIRARFGIDVWRAVGVQAAEDLPRHQTGEDRIVLEAKPPAGSDRPGGNATTFDWSVVKGWVAPGPWILAGGLTLENVSDAIRRTGAQAVDVSSGVERAKGVKDPDLIRKFIAAAKANR